MLEQKSHGESVAFDEELKSLDEKWKCVLGQVEAQKREVEVTARRWWEFTRNKMKMMRWLHRKENDAGVGKPLACIVENPQEQLNNFEVCQLSNHNVKFCFFAEPDCKTDNIEVTLAKGEV